MDYPTNEELYGHIPPISKSLQQQRMRFAGHCWRSKGAGDVLLWRPTHGHQLRGRPKKTYTDQLMDDRGSRLEELPIAMKDRDRCHGIPSKLDLMMMTTMNTCDLFLQEEKSTDEVLCNGIWKMLEKKKNFEKKEKVLWSV